ncbi:hypothetical protein MCOR27_009010 [Pyricularia oryzae]|uniref:DRBM domain-containing protein n=3 Tax=Pyricularia TaxID=48558 RepID=A0ABQ8ND84_PYRGI|nr:hypothetical protein MCOR01_010931 [Pyricularia oryzae]KAI6295194.1 hypothetical protein MCOR33_007865 [Pyricularia grisea]KAI6257722.1 hypothetical protein MCOR19_005878 [Pyricularia oryzae]KAI6271054.1 hypothetical protein MCOR27_009010 [Pyricularia oryzae]KAI6272826.1 hypothetical protein MCOR26_007175 [Pyricularia oryzae]
MSAPAQTGNGNESGLLDFTNIKKWIALQEASQRDTGRPTSLTPAQLKAIRELNQAALVAFAPVEPKPDRNWIGLLHMYRDAHPDGSAIEFVDEDRGMDSRGGGSLWCSFVTLPEAKGLRFPGPHNAVNPDGTLPSFAKKKDAKQFAARCAVEWLMQQQLMPANGESVVFKKARIQTPTVIREAPHRAVEHATTTASASQPPLHQTKTGQPATDPGAVAESTKDEALGDRSFVSQVEQLCTQLGYGRPTYVLRQAENTQIFSGWADWRDEMRVPASVGVVKDVWGKKHAKEKIAEQILSHLEQVQAKRMEKVRAIMEKCQKMYSAE